MTCSFSVKVKGPVLLSSAAVRGRTRPVQLFNSRIFEMTLQCEVMWLLPPVHDKLKPFHVLFHSRFTFVLLKTTLLEVWIAPPSRDMWVLQITPKMNMLHSALTILACLLFSISLCVLYTCLCGHMFLSWQFTLKLIIDEIFQHWPQTRFLCQTTHQTRH